jgi:hypothetical protein
LIYTSKSVHEISHHFFDGGFMSSDESKSIFTAHQAAEQLSIPVRSLQRYAAAIGAGQRIGGGDERRRYLYSKDDLAAIRDYRDSLKVKLSKVPRSNRSLRTSRPPLGEDGRPIESTSKWKRV